jgi:hypothetical protein
LEVELDVTYPLEVEGSRDSGLYLFVAEDPVVSMNVPLGKVPELVKFSSEDATYPDALLP